MPLVKGRWPSALTYSTLKTGTRRCPMCISPLTAAANRPRSTKTPEVTPAGTPWSEEHAQLLLRHVAAGDTTAFEQLYHHYAPRLMGFLRYHLGTAALVDEV